MAEGGTKINMQGRGKKKKIYEVLGGGKGKRGEERRKEKGENEGEEPMERNALFIGGGGSRRKKIPELIDGGGCRRQYVKTSEPQTLPQRQENFKHRDRKLRLIMRTRTRVKGRRWVRLYLFI